MILYFIDKISMKSILDKIILLSTLVCVRCRKETVKALATHSFSIIPIHAGTDMWML